MGRELSGDIRRTGASGDSPVRSLIPRHRKRNRSRSSRRYRHGGGGTDHGPPANGRGGKDPRPLPDRKPSGDVGHADAARLHARRCPPAVRRPCGHRGPLEDADSTNLCGHPVGEPGRAYLMEAGAAVAALHGHLQRAHPHGRRRPLRCGLRSSPDSNRGRIAGGKGRPDSAEGIPGRISLALPANPFGRGNSSTFPAGPRPTAGPRGISPPKKGQPVFSAGNDRRPPVSFCAPYGRPGGFRDEYSQGGCVRQPARYHSGFLRLRGPPPELRAESIRGEAFS